MTETAEQRHERWEREREADLAAITLGLAYQTEQHGIIYWGGNGEQFRSGYWAGKAAQAKKEE
ncbi:hypothetical protein [Comamonas odontotermitis]|uniref:hypothetical protein n=1 Tax=Comamonas odontotermitis TaxID=379895 RepID=UPI001CC72225|nr:hypothetical protein [Comamonas odontotermitis]UBB15477.1 hypothetical protein LAD35_11380 [Comamonas odontotermitis]